MTFAAMDSIPWKVLKKGNAASGSLQLSGGTALALDGAGDLRWRSRAR